MGDSWQDPTETEQERQARLRREAGLAPEAGMGTTGGGTVGGVELPPLPKGVAGDPAYDANPRDYLIQRDREQWRNRLRGVAQPLGFGDWEKAADEELQGVERAVSYAQNAGMDPETALKAAEERLRRRGAPGAGSATNVPGGGPSSTGGPTAPPPTYTGGTVGTGGTGGTGQPIAGESALGDLFRYLQQRDATAAAERASMRDILLSQLGDATRPLDVNDPTLQAILGPQRVQLQRSAERQRSQAVARLASENLQDSGTLDTMLNAIEQQRGEAAAGVTGKVLSQELQNRRDQVARLLQLAMQTGDAESARTLNAQLNLINQQLGQEQSRDQLGYNYTALQAQLARDLLPYQYAPMSALLGQV